MKLKLDEVIAILQQEIDWCLDHPMIDDFTHDQRMGFMNGLRQAQYLIEKAEKAIQADHTNDR